MGFTQVGLVTTDSFCETVRAGFVANEQEISETFGEWFTNCANENKMVTKDNIVAPIIVNKQMLTLSLSKEMQEPLSRALKKAIKEALDEALDENKVLTETNFAEALDKNGVLTEANFAEALDKNKVLTETNLKSTLQTELERNKLYKLAIKDHLAIKVVHRLSNASRLCSRSTSSTPGSDPSFVPCRRSSAAFSARWPVPCWLLCWPGRPSRSWLGP